MSMTGKYMEELCCLLKNTWHKGKKQLFVKELLKLLDKSMAGHGSMMGFLSTNIYDSAAFAVKESKEFFGKNSSSFGVHLHKIKQMRHWHAIEMHEAIAQIFFSVKKSMKMVHDRKYNIRKQVAEEVSFLLEAMKVDSGIVWESPSGCIIQRGPSGCCVSDACLDGGGGYSLDMKYYWYMEWYQDMLIYGMESGRVQQDKEVHLQQQGQ
jgi:hypothetical protein